MSVSALSMIGRNTEDSTDPRGPLWQHRQTKKSRSCLTRLHDTSSTSRKTHLDDNRQRRCSASPRCDLIQKIPWTHSNTKTGSKRRWFTCKPSFMPDEHNLTRPSYEMQVASDARRVGFGRRLLKDCEILARGTGIQKTMLTCLKDNEQGLVFYQRNGYVLRGHDGRIAEHTSGTPPTRLTRPSVFRRNRWPSCGRAGERSGMNGLEGGRRTPTQRGI